MCLILEVSCDYKLYVKVQNIKNNPDQKSKCVYEGNYIMKHVDIWDNVYKTNWKQNAKQL